MRGNDLPTRMPQHPECVDPPRPTVEHERDGDDALTATFTGCALAGRDDGVTVERVVHATANQLLWVQVRAADRAHRQPGAGLGRALRDVGQSSRRRARSASRCCSVSKRQGDWNAR